MPKPELWQGERDQRWQITEQMEEDRAERERHARKSGASGAEEDADYEQRLVRRDLRLQRQAIIRMRSSPTRSIAYSRRTGISRRVASWSRLPTGR